jgi:hypothetical protein
METIGRAAIFDNSSFGNIPKMFLISEKVNSKLCYSCLLFLGVGAG